MPEEFRKGMDGLGVRNHRTDASLAVGVTIRDSGVLGHPPAVGILRSLQVHSANRSANELCLEKRWSGAKISPREGGRNGHSIYYTARTAALAALDRGVRKQGAASLRGNGQD